MIGHCAPTERSRQTGDCGRVSYSGLVLKIDNAE